MADHTYRFRSTWVVASDRTSTYDALADLASYPRWWPQIVAVTEVEPGVAQAVCRSVLPYDVVVRMTSTTEDPAAGVLEVALSGDLAGWSRWTLLDEGPGTRLVYEQEVEARKPLLRAVGAVLKAPLRANHTWMMRGARRGLAGYLAAAPPG